jgi:cell wall-associated NlpC family hydrolase
MNSDEQSAYGLLMQTKGSRQIVANPFDFDWLPLITSYYGYRVHPISGVKNYHKGVDIGVPTGTDIHAGMNGTIAVGYDAGGYGNYITLTGKNNLVANYAHLDTILAANGQSVAMGDIIAKSGNTGNSTGAHLHLEIIKDGQYLDPMIFAETGNTGDNSRNDIVCGIAPPPMSDADFAVLLAEAEKHLGKSYVYGASGPDSFDCSGFACFVINHGTLKNVGRVGATALFRNYTTPIQLSEIMPGDLIFLEKTYSTPTPISHVGLYIGGGWVIHAGNPVQYARIDTAYWQEHFYAVGRLN